MLRLGVFGGKYMTDCRKEFPKSWFARAKLAGERRDASLNYFGVDASQPLSVWRKKGWIYRDDPRGWFQWYCRYYHGPAHSRRGRAPDQTLEGDPPPRRARSSGIANRATSPAGRGSARRCCIGPMTAERSSARGRRKY